MQGHLSAKQKRYQVRSGYVIRQIADEFLLIPVKMQEAGESELAIMNETGKFLWEQLTDPKTEEELAAALSATFDVDQQDAAGDVREFLDLLRNYHCIVKMEE